MQSTIAKRSVIVGGHQTSVSLEDAFWNGLKEIGRRHNRTLSDLVGDIDSRRQQGNLSSAIRLFVLDQLRRSPLSVGIEPIHIHPKQTIDQRVLS